VILASTGYFRLLPIMYLINKIFKRKVYEICIGGIRYEFLNRVNIFLEHSITAIYVETMYMLEKYKEVGLDKVYYMPNFKKIYRNAIPEKNTSELKICTFSRIDENKGIDTAVQIMKKLENRDDISLDIIGPVKEEYEVIFEEIIGHSGKNVKYCGSVKRDDINDYLGKYDVLLFPTRWKAEGFPGIFLDAFENGIIVLATDLPAFQNVIINDKNGRLFPVNGIEEYARYILELADNTEKRRKMKNTAFEYSKKYDSKHVLMHLVDDIFG